MTVSDIGLINRTQGQHIKRCEGSVTGCWLDCGSGAAATAGASLQGASSLLRLFQRGCRQGRGLRTRAGGVGRVRVVVAMLCCCAWSCSNSRVVTFVYMIIRVTLSLHQKSCRTYASISSSFSSEQLIGTVSYVYKLMVCYW